MADRSSQAAPEGTRCAAATTVPHADFEVLLGLRHRVGLPQRDLRCELAADHGGRHVAFALAADGGDEWWWASWDAERGEVLRLEPCDRVCPDEHDDCLLPAGHAGLHNYEF